MLRAWFFSVGETVALPGCGGKKRRCGDKIYDFPFAFGGLGLGGGGWIAHTSIT